MGFKEFEIISLDKIRPIILTLWLQNMWEMPAMVSIENKLLTKDQAYDSVGEWVVIHNRRE